MSEENFERLRFNGPRTLFVHEWNVVGHEGSRDVGAIFASRLIRRSYKASADAKAMV
jgi:hypothetical protein